MAAPHDSSARTSTALGLVKAAWRGLASLRLAVILLVILAAVLAWATLLESHTDRETAQWYVYGSQWFIALLALLAANVLAATLIRFPWKKSQIGFLITHVGLLVLLAGAIRTLVGGVEGQLMIAEGDTQSAIVVPQRSQIQVATYGPSRRRCTVSFTPGPVDWAEGESLDFGLHDGIGIKVLRYFRHARSDVSWTADESGLGGPALKLAVAGPDGAATGEGWLTANAFGGEAAVASTRCALLPASSGSMLKDFLEPPAMKAGTEGVLSMHYKGRMYRVAVHDNLGKKVPVGDSGISVRIVKYLPNAMPTGRGQFVSRGTEPKKPMLELQVYLSDKKKPVRQIAFAQTPLLNLDGVHGFQCPVKFWYHHPAVLATSGVEFLQTPDGKLYCRVGAQGKYQARGEVKVGDRIEMDGKWAASVVEYLPTARREVAFRPVRLAPGQSGAPDAAVLVELTAGGTTQQTWLQQDSDEYEFRRMDTPEGPVALAFGDERLPLGFSLKLLSFQRGLNPGRMGDASFASTVRLVDPAHGVNERRVISMNEPLEYGGYRFYQSGFKPMGRNVSYLTVARDPGRFLKYLSIWMIGVGMFITFYVRPGTWKKLVPPVFRSRRAAKSALPSGNGQGTVPGSRTGRQKRRHGQTERVEAT